LENIQSRFGVFRSFPEPSLKEVVLPDLLYNLRRNRVHDSARKPSSRGSSHLQPSSNQVMST